MYNSNKEELEILKYWDEHQVFEKSVNERPENKPYVFYDGPPFATGLPHYGHIVASLMKDVVPRYWTMRGFRVERRWGWDCHGLPVENIIEKELNLNSRKDILDYGVDRFNQACRSTVLKYAEEWKKTIRRMGRWVDMENDYKTMDITFMESVWWVFRSLWDKGLIYKGHKAMHICPHCVTPLSNFEVTQGYKDVKDISVTAKFKVVNNDEKHRILGEQLADKELYILAWTTTPWTLPGNVLLAVNREIEYELVINKEDQSYYLLAAARRPAVLKDKIEGTDFEVVGKYVGSDLEGLSYKPLFPYYQDTENAFRVVGAEFVTTEDGTGVVHIAPAFGEDDYNLGKVEGVPLVQHVNMEGKFVEEVLDFVGQDVKPKDDPTKVDVEIIKYLAKEGRLFSKEKFEHSYPHCWRCDTPLLNYATTSWFVSVSKIKEELLKNNAKTNWVPAHIKDGRFGQWLEGARDWAISRNRYWGTPLPVWEAEDGEALCVGSVEELENLTGQTITDLHKDFVDNLEVNKDGKVYRRIPEVLDCWFESGSMPYGQMHYPFENKDKFEHGFPAEFIAEGQDQTRGWFYTLHILATALTKAEKPIITPKGTLGANKDGVPAFKNVIVNGIVLAEDGKKMSKRLKNYPEPDLVLEKYGADAMRYYLVTSPVMEAESLNFSETGVREVYAKLINTLWNVVEFYNLFKEAGTHRSNGSNNVLDRWILAKLQVLTQDVTNGLESYKLINASRPILDFVTELSQWYVRRSRDRFKGDNQEDKKQALATLNEVLFTLSKLMAPFTPFIAEKIYQEMGGELESVHLEMWPESSKIDRDVLNSMSLVRELIERVLFARNLKRIKVRQPLAEIVLGENYWMNEDYLNILLEETNIKKVTKAKDFRPDQNMKRWFPIRQFMNNIDETILMDTDIDADMVLADIEITTELKREGLVREIVRTVNQLRKNLKLTISDRVNIVYETSDEELSLVIKQNNEEIKKSVLANELQSGDAGEEMVEVDGREIKMKLIVV